MMTWFINKLKLFVLSTINLNHCAQVLLLCNESIQFTTGQLYRHKESFCCGDGVGLVSLFTHTEGEIMIHDAKKISTPSRRSIKVVETSLFYILIPVGDMIMLNPMTKLYCNFIKFWWNIIIICRYKIFKSNSWYGFRFRWTSRDLKFTRSKKYSLFHTIELVGILVINIFLVCILMHLIVLFYL